MMYALTSDAWFAGFTDGEGSFQIRKSEGGARYSIRFSIGLRADDALVLEELQGIFGGCLVYSGRKDSAWGQVPGGIAPQVRWQVSAKPQLAALIEYFDRFPLRAKKARDYVIWRRAFKVYCAGGGRDPRLPGLYEALQQCREFDADEPDLSEPFEVQMALGIGDGRSAS